jgi:hypothetical protein
MKLRAVMQGRTLRDLATELLNNGLRVIPDKPPEPLPAHSMVKLRANGLPVVQCAAQAPAQRMSAQDLVRLGQKALAQEDVQRVGLPV